MKLVETKKKGEFWRVTLVPQTFREVKILSRLHERDASFIGYQFQCGNGHKPQNTTIELTGNRHVNKIQRVAVPFINK